MFLFNSVGKVFGGEIERQRLQSIVDDMTADLVKKIDLYTVDETVNHTFIWNEWVSTLKGIYELQAGDDQGDETCMIAVRRRMLNRNIGNINDCFLSCEN